MDISIVVVGPGQIGKKHAALIRANPDTRLVAVAAPDHVPKDAATSGVQLHTSLDACAAVECIDAVVLSSPNPYHFEHARWSIERGIPGSSRIQ